MTLIEADLFTIIYGSISLVLLVIILILSIAQSKQKDVKWYKSFWNLKSILLPAIDHIADTVSDIAMIIEFYVQSRKELQTKGDIRDYNASQPNSIIFFVLAVLIILIYRTKSSFVIYRISRNWWRTLAQFLFDLELYRAIYINTKLNPTKPISLYKYIRQDECFYESLPQFMLTMIYMLYSGGNNHFIVYLSIFFSLKSLTDRFITFDGLVFISSANTLHISLSSFKKCKFCSDFTNSVHYIARSIFRFCDVTSRVVMLCFVWTVISYVAFCILFAIEMLIWLVSAIWITTKMLREKAWLYYVALLVYPPGPHKGENWLCKWLPLMQTIRSSVVLILLYLFIFIPDIQCNEKSFICVPYQRRHDFIVDSAFNLSIFVVCNVLFVISVILYPVIKPNLLESQLKATEVIATDIWYPARAGNAIDLMANIEYGSEVNVCDERNRCALHYAASRGHIEVVNILLSYGKDLNVNIQDNRKWTSLHFAVRYAYKNCKNMDSIDAILKEGYKLDVNLQTNKGETALILASKPPFPDDVNLKCVAKLLVEKNKEYELGMDLNLKDDDGNSALSYWKQIGDSEMCQLLLGNGANEHDTNQENNDMIV